MNSILAKRQSVLRKKRRIRKNISGRPVPRLSVYRSASTSTPVIDDLSGRPLRQQRLKTLRDAIQDLGPTEVRPRSAKTCRSCSAAGVQVVFDRNGRRYAGRVAALAEAPVRACNSSS